MAVHMQQMPANATAQYCENCIGFFCEQVLALQFVRQQKTIDKIETRYEYNIQ